MCSRWFEDLAGLALGIWRGVGFRMEFRAQSLRVRRPKEQLDAVCSTAQNSTVFVQT